MTQNDFIKTVAPFQDKVFRLAKRLLISTEEAEDATQEVLVKLWNKNEVLNQYNSVEALAMTMTKNFCLDQLKSKRAGNRSITHSNYSNREASLDKVLEDKDSLSWVEKSINQLPTQQRMIVQLREIEELEFAEIAKIMDMKEIAVRVALSRARKAIKDFMLKTHGYGNR
jgi:RNA polymerase sigma-70 factor (ECF subfamily)